MIGDTLLLGDFNSVTVSSDRHSQNLDSTSKMLEKVLSFHKFYEPQGTHIHHFSYHHPSIAERKSRIDCIYSTYPMQGLQGFSKHILFSDHYLIGTFQLKPVDIGPHPWHFPIDLLEDPERIAQLELILSGFDKKSAISSWEGIKLKIQSVMQNATAFHRKQLNQELHSLKKSLNPINKHIYSGKCYLKCDLIQLQLSLEELHQKMHNRTPEEEVEWVNHEGTMSPRFLNLEKGQRENTLASILKDNTELMSVEDILTVITDFYTNLYDCHDTKTSDQIESFLVSRPTLPVITRHDNPNLAHYRKGDFGSHYYAQTRENSWL